LERSRWRRSSPQPLRQASSTPHALRLHPRSLSRAPRPHPPRARQPRGSRHAHAALADRFRGWHARQGPPAPSARRPRWWRRSWSRQHRTRVKPHTLWRRTGPQPWEVLQVQPCGASTSARGQRPCTRRRVRPRRRQRQVAHLPGGARQVQFGVTPAKGTGLWHFTQGVHSRRLQMPRRGLPHREGTTRPAATRRCPRVYRRHSMQGAELGRAPTQRAQAATRGPWRRPRVPA